MKILMLFDIKGLICLNAEA